MDAHNHEQTPPQLSDAVRKSHQRRCALSLSARATRWLKIGIALVVVNYALYWLLCLVPLKHYSMELMEWIQANKLAGSIVFPLAYWLLTPLCIPSSMFDLIGGSVFGLFYGIVLNTIGKTGGALITFALGKKIGRERVGGYLETNFPTFSVISTILQSESWKPLLLVQLSSLPHAVKSYGLAITDVSTYRFIVSSFVATLPFTIVLTHIGYETQEMLLGPDSGSGGASAESSSSSAQVVLFALGMVLTVVTMVFFVIYTKKELQRQLSKVGATEKRDSSSTAARRCSDDFDFEGRELELIVLDHLLPTTQQPSSYESLPKHRCSSC
ncbi:hypothetical protein Gpo141_00003493 [Globisporangium polare]